MARRPIKFTFDGDAGGLERSLNEATEGLRDVARQANRTEGSLRDLDGQDVRIGVEMSALNTLQNRLRAAKADLLQQIEVDVDLDSAVALKRLTDLDRQIRRIDGRKAKIDVDVDKDNVSGGLVGALRNAGPAMGASLSGLATNPYVAAGAAILGAGIAAAITPTIVSTGLGIPIAKSLADLTVAWDQMDKMNRKVDIVFGNQAAGIRDWAKSLSTDVGLGKREIEQMAASVQDLLVPIGYKRSTAAGLTKEIIARGAALAEWGGKETADGVDAVTKALLGQTRSLTQFGVKISADDIKEKARILAKSDAYDGLNNKQLTTAATLELIKERSKDAWNAFENGGSSADTAVDKVNATLANLKTDAIEGFGSIWNEVLGSLMSDIGINFDDGGLADWIKENRESIKLFFLDLANVALLGAESVISMIPAFIDLGSAIMGTVSGVLWFSEKFAALMRMLAEADGNEGAARVWGGIEAQAKDTKASLDQMRDGLKGLKPAAEEAASKGKEAIGKLRKAVDEATEKQRVIKVDMDDQKARMRLQGITMPKSVTVTPRVDTSAAEAVAARLRNLSTTRFVYYNPVTGGTVTGGSKKPKASSGAAPQVNIHLQDERLADLVAVEVNGFNLSQRRSAERRLGVI